jgi:hypothetical protein
MPTGHAKGQGFAKTLRRGEQVRRTSNRMIYRREHLECLEVTLRMFPNLSRARYLGTELIRGCTQTMVSLVSTSQSTFLRHARSFSGCQTRLKTFARFHCLLHGFLCVDTWTETPLRLIRPIL